MFAHVDRFNLVTPSARVTKYDLKPSRTAGNFVGINNPNNTEPDLVHRILRTEMKQQKARQKKMKQQNFKLTDREIIRRAGNYAMLKATHEATQWQRDPVLKTESTHRLIEAYYRQKWAEAHQRRRQQFMNLIAMETGSEPSSSTVDDVVGASPAETPTHTPYPTGAGDVELKPPHELAWEMDRALERARGDVPPLASLETVKRRKKKKRKSPKKKKGRK